MNDLSFGPTFNKKIIEENEIIEYYNNIDLCITNSRTGRMIANWQIDSNLKITKHNLIKFNINRTKINNRTFEHIKIDYEKCNWQTFFNTFDNLKPEINSSSNYEVMFKRFDLAVKSAFKKGIVVKKKKSSIGSIMN
jgi:hypothetical protein